MLVAHICANKLPGMIGLRRKTVFYGGMSMDYVMSFAILGMSVLNLILSILEYQQRKKK